MEVTARVAVIRVTGDRTRPSPGNGGRGEGRGGQVGGTESWILAEFGSVTTATALDERRPFVNAECP